MQQIYWLNQPFCFRRDLHNIAFVIQSLNSNGYRFQFTNVPLYFSLAAVLMGMFLLHQTGYTGLTVFCEKNRGKIWLYHCHLFTMFTWIIFLFDVHNISRKSSKPSLFLRVEYSRPFSFKLHGYHSIFFIHHNTFKD